MTDAPNAPNALNALNADLIPPAPPKNQQFSRLNSFRRERVLVDVYLVSGVRLRGRIKSFDQYSLMLDIGQGETFLYHHAVSSIGPVQGKPGQRRPGGGDSRGPGGPGGPRGRGRPDGGHGGHGGDGGGHGGYGGHRDGPRRPPEGLRAEGPRPLERGLDDGPISPGLRRPGGQRSPSEVTVVRRVSRKISIPRKDEPDESGSR